MSIASTVRFYRFQLIIALATISVLFSHPSPAAVLVDLDATAFESVSGDPVTQWTNQAGNHYHAITTKGTVRYPSSFMTASGLPGLDFSGGCNQMDIMEPRESKRLLDFSNETGGFAVMIVFTDLSNLSSHDDWSALIGNAVRDTEGFYIRYHARDNDLRFSLAGNQHIGKIAEGDCVLVGINYDADAGVVTAAMITSTGIRETMNAMVPAQDFSTRFPLSMGNAVTKHRYLDGLISKVMVYDNELSDGDFLDKMQSLAQIWINPKAKTLGLLVF